LFEEIKAFNRFSSVVKPEKVKLVTPFFIIIPDF